MILLFSRMAVKKEHRCTRAPLRKSEQQIFKNKEQHTHMTTEDKKNKKAIIIAQEIKFARLLSSNDKRVRDKILKNLRKWLTVRSKSTFAFTEADFTRLWKGLFYCMWMSDKPLIQEELAESLSKISHCFNIKDVVLLYTMCALKTLGIEWFGIDQYRLDKFSMLVRRIIRQTFVKCKERSWDIEWIKGFAEILQKLFIDPKICLGFKMHVTEVFLEELSKISGGDIPEDAVTEFLKPFITYFIIMDDEQQIKHVMRYVFKYLIYQSDIGMDYMEKFKAWRDAGFPAGSIDAMAKIDISDEELEDRDIYNKTEELPESRVKSTTEKTLDARAGRVDVELPQISFNAKKIVTLLSQYKYHPSSTTKSRRYLNCVIKEFMELSEGRMPLGIKEIRIPYKRKKDTDTKSAAMSLLNFENDLYSDTVRKKQKRNKRLMEDENIIHSNKDSEDINDENDLIKGDTTDDTKKKKKYEKECTYNETPSDSQVSNTKTVISQKKKGEPKKQTSDNCKISTKTNNCKAKKDPLHIIKSNNGCEKMKLKQNKSVIANMLSIVTPVKRKRTKLTVCNKWDISDNISSSTLKTLDDNTTESCTKSVKKSSVNDSLQNRTNCNEPATWILPIVKKVKNEKSRTIRNTTGQLKVHSVSNFKKRVKIALQRNTAQHTSEYILQVQKSPSIPFDANKKPLVGVLKANPIPSPINPFYKKIC
ncbi:PREDICTED: ribosomal RNA processing protein 1 homolog [Dufourea novaeangliae]|uniref:ribosomal RNA processing protein 1 homolog n=1 Tax=Dufourea novaeangliae TaxID=178035 RepID=UPI000767C543|nr:PREDICTED: ribosomal RNA processing protein 1 homolog [Dufourea novaeangliae]